MNILDYINQNTNDAYKDFKLVSVIFDEEKLELTCKFLYKDTIADNAREELYDLITKYFNEPKIKVVVKCKKAYIDEGLVRDVLYNFIIKNFNSIGLDFEKSRIDVTITDYIAVVINCNEFQYQYINGNSVENEIINYANSFFFEDFELSLNVDAGIKSKLDDNIIPVLDIDLRDTSSPEYKYHKIDNLQNFIGEVNGNPIQISSIKSAMEGIEVAGTLKFLNQKSFESKRKDKEGNTIIKDFFRFVITDKTGRIDAVYFPTKADNAKSMTLAEGQNIIVKGDVELFNDRLSIKVKAIAYCDILEEVKEEEKEEEVEIVTGPNDKYVYVQPEPHIEMFQDNLFMVAEDPGEYLKTHDVVVFDLETTGLEVTKCEIVEIGAVKISKGKIVETFETLVKPSCHIPEDSTDIHGITDEMVANSPSIRQVLPDFYKFCYGATIMAYNIDFDYKFISIWGKKQGLIFDNKQMDALLLARLYVPGLKNFSLSTVCKKLGVSLENAHRAVHDAMATAEVVIKIGPNITEK